VTSGNVCGDCVFTALRYSIFVRKINLSADEFAIDRAREVAQSEGKTLDEAFEEWLEWYASRNITHGEIEALFRSLKHVRAGRKFSRDEMNQR
jgi:hypothetical protein